MTEFEIIFVVFGIGACIVGAIHVTIAYRSSIRDVEPDPERVRRFVKRGMELRRQALENSRATDRPSDDVIEPKSADLAHAVRDVLHE